ncbi:MULTISPECIES: hypothetical protein [unclassified Pseudactinotalea]|uniref:hypothetical protein n=1 Tax=unclassified Pseudactinotalea TaxID=2649176 RepID=UPI00128C9EDE|nr:MULTISPECIES: hypothetical protein [unclassified Pseudactinotalea]MPV48821.1 hypothetical protein [Pseudactinotalea sp. HY160]QGH68804.1 hypothetical protein GCE65_04305 [Pseudactinotalea sp. HY158]
MATPRPRTLLIAPLAIGVVLLAGCSDNGSPSNEGTSPGTPSPVPAQTTGSDDETFGSTSSGSDDECYVHLFDANDFDETDDNFKLTEPGRYKDLADLPGADQDWTDEADSAKVGTSATVTIWSEPNFEGKESTLDPSSEHAALDPEPSSLELTC